MSCWPGGGDSPMSAGSDMVAADAFAARGVEVSGAAVAAEIGLPRRVAGEADRGAGPETGESECRTPPSTVA